MKAVGAAPFLRSRFHHSRGSQASSTHQADAPGRLLVAISGFDHQPRDPDRDGHHDHDDDGQREASDRDCGHGNRV